MKSLSSEVATDDEEGSEVFENAFKDELRNITVELEGKELWERFSELGTEMIITKAGRWNIHCWNVKCTNLEKKAAFTLCHQLIHALTANKTVPEVKVVKKIRAVL